jgi:beta-glucanase (GH16 family)
MITTTLLAPGKARITLDGITRATITGYVDTTILGTNLADILTVNGMVRGTITTAGGNDVVAITTGLGTTADLITLDTGTGNDSVTFRGAKLGQARLDLGTGNDTLTISGARSADISMGDGDDLVTLALDGSYTLHGGNGNDGLILNILLRDLSFDRAANDAAILWLTKTPAYVVQFDGFERIRFNDGSVLTAAQLDAYLPALSARPSGAPVNGIGGTTGNDSLVGTALNNSMWGGGGTDTMAGGAGDDTYQVNGTETVIELASQGIDTVQYALDEIYILPTYVENLVLQNGTNRQLFGPHEVYLGYKGGASGIGNAANNWMVGSAADNTLDGRGGQDVLTGGAGGDTFVFGIGYGPDRVVDFAPGTDYIRLVSGPTTWSAAYAAMTDTAAGVVLRLSDTDTLTLTGVRKSALSADDFEFSVDLTKYHLSFSDEFTSFARFDGRTGADGGTWRTRATAGDGLTNNENDKQSFVDVNYGGLGLNPFSAADGVLSINATWRPDLAAALGGRSIASGIITTDGAFAQQFGYYEARLKMSAQTGGQPGFWLLPTDGTWPPEIDIAEQIGRQPGQVYQMGNNQPVDTTQWHVYGLEWTTDHLAWYLDGQLTYEVHTRAFQKPMYVILSYALGTPWAGDVPTGLTTGASLGSLQVDYLRVYEANSGAAPAVTIPDGAPDVTFSVGNLAVGGTAAAANRWHYVADTSGPLTLLPRDFNFAASGVALNVTVTNDRQADSYTARITNGFAAANVQVQDSDGGSYSFDNLAMAELKLGGSKASTVSLTGVQAGLVETGTGNDTVTLATFPNWTGGRSTTMQVSTGGGNDSITGWTNAAGRLEARGGDGDDTIIASGGSNLIEGGAGNDRISGLTSTTGSLEARGGDGDDTISASGGIDLIEGGAGNDRVSCANGGADTLLFVKGQGGYDTVLSFGVGDVLRLQGFTKAELALVDIATGVEVRLPGETILLSGLKVAGLGDWAFAFASA